MDEELTCQQLVELVTDYLDGSLDAARREQFEQHLVGCRGCVTYLEQFRETIALTGRLGPHDVPDAVLQELLRAFRGVRPPP